VEKFRDVAQFFAGELKDSSGPAKQKSS